jgi:DNA-binding CsgD family transcriptional regulator
LGYFIDVNTFQQPANIALMQTHFTPIDLKKAFGKQNYLILGDKYKQELANHPLVRNLWTIGHFFVAVANTFTWKIELACGECELVSGYTAEEIESEGAKWIMNFGLPEDTSFNMAATQLSMQYINSRAIEERELIFAAFFYRARSKDGKVITVQHQSIPLYFDENKIPFVFSNIFTDISYLGITKIPHAVSINRFTDEVFHIEPNMLQLIKAGELFSPREREIIQLLARGNNSRLIAQQLFISQETVRTHRKNILKKAGVNSTVELTGYALTHGII